MTATLFLDHLTVIAPTLEEGVAHVRQSLDVDVPFGQRHLYMGTWNHLVQLGGEVYLEIVARDPGGASPPCARWFGLDRPDQVRADWDAGRRLRGWVARTAGLDRVLADRPGLFGRKVALPWEAPTFDFAIPDDGSLPLDGAAPSLIDRRGKRRNMETMADLGLRLHSFSLDHPQAETIAALYRSLGVDRPPACFQASAFRYSALIDTPRGRKILT